MYRLTKSLVSRSLLSSIALIAALGSLAQDQPPPPLPHPSQQVRPSGPLSDSAFQEKLVSLALGGPQYDATVHQVNIARYKVRSAQLSWFNLLTVSLNYNDLEFKQGYNTTATAAYIYPKYFFGIVIPIGTIVSKGSEIKAAREDVKIAQDAQLQMARQIRADVLTKYATYRNHRDLAVLQNQIVDDLSVNFAQTEKKFRDGIVTIETYSLASHNFNEANAKKLDIQLQAEITKYELERVIGVRLESVAH